jgi:hypothetical protein
VLLTFCFLWPHHWAPRLRPACPAPCASLGADFRRRGQVTNPTLSLDSTLWYYIRVRSLTSTQDMPVGDPAGPAGNIYDQTGTFSIRVAVSELLDPSNLPSASR